MSHLRAWQSWWSLWWAADCRSSQCGSCCVLEASDEAFPALSGEVLFKAEIETEVVTFSESAASVSATITKEDPGAVGRSGFLGNSLRVSSERREQFEWATSGAGSEIEDTHECSLMVKNDTHCREWERMDVALGDYAVAGLVEVCNLCATSVIKPYITEDNYQSSIDQMNKFNERCRASWDVHKLHTSALIPTWNQSWPNQGCNK